MRSACRTTLVNLCAGARSSRFNPLARIGPISIHQRSSRAVRPSRRARAESQPLVLPLREGSRPRNVSRVTPQQQPERRPAKGQLGILFSAKNLLKTVASQFPIASAGVEMLNQLDGERVSERLARTETQVKSLAETRSAETDPAPAVPALQDWSYATGQWMQRTVHLAIVYDGDSHSGKNRGAQLVQRIAHGSVVGPNEVLTCREALEVLNAVAREKHGRAIAISGFAWYEFTAEEPDEASGLVLCKLTKRDEVKWAQMVAIWQTHDLGVPRDDAELPAARATTMPWIGQEIGFIHEGEAPNASLVFTFYPVQFDSSVISHFRRAHGDGLKVFVSGVLPGRVLRTGSAVFGRDATLLGVIADTESFSSDAGRRAIVRGLLGHPRFTKFTSQGSAHPRGSKNSP